MKNYSFNPSVLRRLRIFSAIASISLSLNAVSTKAETFVSTGGTLNWTNNTSWVENTVPNAIGAAAFFNTPAASQTASLAGSTASGGITIGSISFNATGTPTIGVANGTGGGPLTFDGIGDGPATITTTGTGAANSTISATLVFTDSVNIIANNTVPSAGVTLSGAISGSGGLTKDGDGKATISVLNKSYIGATVLNGGRTRISFSGMPTGTSNFTINAGAQMEMLTAGAYTLGTGSVNLNGTGPSGGPDAAFPGAIRNTTGTIITINNPVVLQSATTLHMQALGGTGVNATPTGSLTLANSVSGPGSLTLTAPSSNVDQGSLILSGNNTYQGGTFVNGGIVVLNAPSATLGTGNVTVDNAAAPQAIARLSIQTGVSNAIADTATLSLAGGLAGTVILGDSVDEVVGALTLAGAIQPTGTYGSSTSTATNKNDQFFSGNGIITVAASAVAPTLTIVRSGSNVIISWPTSATGYVLEQTTVLTSGVNNFTPVTEPVIVSGSENTVTVAASGSTMFFRLKK